MSVQSGPLPEQALLQKYADGSQSVHSYTDCFSIVINQTVTLPEFVLAFYTTAVFKLERWILRWLVSKPSSDQQAADVAEGRIDAFAAWILEQRSEGQLLMCDFTGRTRSWFMVTQEAGEPGKTRLWFGSAVVHKDKSDAARRKSSGRFNLLLGFHKLYSRVLLSSAKRRLEKTPG